MTLTISSRASWETHRWHSKPARPRTADCSALLRVLLPPNEEEAIHIVSGVRERYEKFHGVVVTNEAIEAAVSASRWFLRHRHLPDRAIDLIDEAGARVRLRCDSEPREIVEIRKRIRLVTRQMENAIANHEFDKARLFSEEERKERQNLQRLREELTQNPQSNIITPEDIVEAVAGRAGVPFSVVKSVLQVKEAEQLELIEGPGRSDSRRLPRMG